VTKNEEGEEATAKAVIPVKAEFAAAQPVAFL